MKILKKVVSVLMASLLLVFSIPAQAASTTDLPAKVASELGFTSNITASTSGTGISAVTRAQFAQLLLNASSYKGNSGSSVQYTLFNDVSSSDTYAPAIYTAVEQGWMSGYLTGSFKPDQAVTLREAISGVIALLGYTSSDFTGNQAQGRVALYYSSGLSDDMTAKIDGTVNMSDCIQLLYNLMKTNTKSGALYGKLFDCTLDSDGEVDYLSLLSGKTTTVKGPIQVTKDLDKILPFDPDDATIFIDGDIGAADGVNDGDILYYSSRTKTVWVYEENVISGTVTGIGYDVSGSLTPTSIYIDDTKLLLSTDDMKLAFTVGGTSNRVKVGDSIIAVYDETTSSTSETTYTLKGYMLDD